MSSNPLLESYATFNRKDLVTLDEYKKVVNTFFITLCKRIILEGKIYRLPYKLGMIGVLKHVPVYSRWVDWTETVKEGRMIKRSNFHSDNYMAKVYWKTTFPIVTIPVIPSYWEFRLNRDSKRELARSIRDNNTIHKYYNKDDY